MAKMVENADTEGDKDGGGNVNSSILAFQKLCPRICKLLNGQNFQAKAALLGVVASLSQNLSKIISNIVKRLMDSDPSIRNACYQAIGDLSRLYLKRGAESRVQLSVGPILKAMQEQNNVFQLGAAMCMAKMVENVASDVTTIKLFQKLCPKNCKLFNSQTFRAKAALLGVVSSLSQVGAIAPQNLEPLLQSIHECLGSPDWATRKAAADSLCALGLHSSKLITEGPANSTLTVLEDCCFHKVSTFQCPLS